MGSWEEERERELRLVCKIFLKKRLFLKKTLPFYNFFHCFFFIQNTCIEGSLHVLYVWRSLK